MCVLSFEEPAQPLGTVGSTAARFFKLVPRDLGGFVGSEGPFYGCGHRPCESGEALDTASDASPLPGGDWIGKDSSQAQQELAFLDRARLLRDQEGWRIFDSLVDYYGVLRCQRCLVPTGSGARIRNVDLLVFRSPFEGLARPRLLNMAVGPRSAARYQPPGTAAGFARMDAVRIEGFMCPPASVASESPTADSRGWAWGDVSQRRAKGLPLQRMSVVQALAGFMDLRDAIKEERLWPTDGAASFAAQFLSPTEYSELALLVVIRELSSLVAATTQVPVPQKWVGSSVGLLADVGAAPPRQGPIGAKAWVDARVRLRLFGWHASSVTRSAALDPTTWEENRIFWTVYQDSLVWILWESCRLYHHAFCTQNWTGLRVDVYASTARGEPPIGAAEMRLDKASGLRLPLLGPTGEVLLNAGKAAELTVSASRCTFPKPSRLGGSWCVRVESAANLPPGAPADIFAIVTLTFSDGVMGKRAQARTKLAPSSDPVWNEEFDFPVLHKGEGDLAGQRLCEALGCPAGSMAEGLAKHLPAPSQAAQEERSAAAQAAFVEKMRSLMDYSCCETDKLLN